MKKRFVAAGLLAGGITLAGVAGSAYGEGGTPTAKPARPATRGGPVLVSCTGTGTHTTGTHTTGKPATGGHGIVTMKKDGKLPPLPPPGTPSVRLRGTKALPAPPAGRRTGTTIIVQGDGPGSVKIGSVPKGVHCSTAKPGTPAPSIPGR